MATSPESSNFRLTLLTRWSRYRYGDDPTPDLVLGVLGGGVMFPFVSGLALIAGATSGIASLLGFFNSDRNYWAFDWMMDALGGGESSLASAAWYIFAYGPDLLGFVGLHFLWRRVLAAGDRRPLWADPYTILTGIVSLPTIVEAYKFILVAIVVLAVFDAHTRHSAGRPLEVHARRWFFASEAADARDRWMAYPAPTLRGTIPLVGAATWGVCALVHLLWHIQYGQVGSDYFLMVPLLDSIPFVNTWPINTALIHHPVAYATALAAATAYALVRLWVRRSLDLDHIRGDTLVAAALALIAMPTFAESLPLIGVVGGTYILANLVSVLLRGKPLRSRL